MTKKHLAEELLNRYIRSSCSEEERAMVESWHLKDLSESNDIPSKETILLVNQRMRSALSAHTGYPHPFQRTQKLWSRLAYIASALFLIPFLYYLYTDQPVQKNQLTLKKKLIDISPGSKKAILTISGGTKISLDGNAEAFLAKETDVNVHKSAHGILIYGPPKGENNTVYTHILETPKGGHYQLDLPDGTKVWLNAASSLTYPTAFKDKERNVTLRGEAYFEVTKDKNKPFKVKSGQQIIEVLGTHFNVFAYPEERKIQTTLLEGSIKIIKGNRAKLIRPGQSATTVDSTASISIADADLEKSLAWKNNEFIFNGENLESIMKSVSRWYNIEIVYQRSSGKTKYWGVVSRNQNLSAVLKMLQSTGKVSFKIEGRRLTVMD